jgi:hypothetical protein
VDHTSKNSSFMGKFSFSTFSQEYQLLWKVM